MTARLASGVLVSSLIRRAQAEGGSAAVLARGDSVAGGVLVILAQRGEIAAVLERGYDLNGLPEWRPAAPQLVAEPPTLSDYLARRRRSDPDLWAVELDIADSERFAAEMTAAG